MNKSPPRFPDEDYEGYAAAGLPAGVPVPPLSDEDIRLLEEAWNNPRAYELSKDEPIAAAGWVPKSTVDPNRTLLPSSKDIADLPRWARVAFAVRCARRVLPLVKTFWADVSVQHLRALNKVVSVVEYASAHASANVDICARAADDAYTAAHDAVDDAAYDAAYAAHAAAHAARAVYAAHAAERAVAYAIQSLLRGVTIGTINHFTAPARDIDLLSRLAKKEQWTDDTPVPTTVFGPMWEGTPPEWWTDDVLANVPSELTAESEAHDEYISSLK